MGFDRLAGVYATLERMVFGGLLQRARTAHLERFAGAGEVLLLGDGDGRFLEALLVERARKGIEGRVVSVDASAGMLERARSRVAGLPGTTEVEFVHSPLEVYDPPSTFRPAAVSAHFVLDCFGDDILTDVLTRVRFWVASDSILVISDFAVPRRGVLRRLASRALLWAMYRFFRIATDLPARTLPDFHKALSGSDWREGSDIQWLGGFVFSGVWQPKK